jgi:simple sugar transport system permease protein
MNIMDQVISAKADSSSFPALRQAFGSHDYNNVGLLILLAALCIGFSVALPGLFATRDTLSSILFQLPEFGLLALAMLLPLLSGGINLSIIASANMSALSMAWMLTHGFGPLVGHTVAIIVVALAAGFALSLVVGVITGYLVATVNAHPILVTLGAMSIVNGACVWLTRGKPIAGFPEEFQLLGSTVLLGVPLPFWIFLAATVIVGLYLSQTRHGVAVYMIGSNLKATRYSGVDTRRVLIAVYTISALLCWVAAILMMARFNSASAGYAQSYLLITVLAAVLGGVDPFGGFGKVSGLFIALLILQVISSGLNLLGVTPQLTQAMWGGTMILVMAVRFALQRNRGRRG